MTTMENPSKRLSMNTSLKNAGIFEEDSWDEEKFKSLKDHDESLDSSVDDENKPKCKTEIHIKEEIIDTRPNTEVHIKKEIKTEYKDSVTELKIKKEVECNVKLEEPDNVFVEMERKPQVTKMNRIKEEVDDEFVETERKIKIKKEEEQDMSDDEEEDEFVMEIPSTPIKTEPLPNGPTLNPSPFTKDLFTNFSIESPGSKVKQEPSNSRQEPLKSYKRTVFSRHSPYKRDIPDYLASGDERRSVQDRLWPEVSEGSSDSEDVKTHLPIKKRLGPIVEQCELPKKKVKLAEKETDPATLARRQKQIDYGKNTIAYDNYIRKVDRKDRTSDDPMTPIKHRKYSRRAWDGLIKQWRLRLHKYDTE